MSLGVTPWGDGLSLEQTAVSRIIAFTRGPNFSALMRFLGTRSDTLAEQIKGILIAFDLDSAVGVQLTRIGEIVQRPRDGMEDERYRRVLRAWIDIILASQGSTDTLFAVVRAITGEAAPEYSETYPKTFSIGAYVDPDEITLLAELIRNAKDWGTNGSLVAYPPGAAPGEGGVLIADSVGDYGLWSMMDDRIAAVRMSSTGAEEIESGQAGVLDGTTWVPAFEARNLNGATDRIDLLTSPLDLSIGQSYTIAAWCRFETLSGLRVIATAASTGPAFAAILRTNGDALEYSHAYNAGTGIRVVSSTGLLVTGQWYHVAAIVSGTATASETTLCIDGSPVSGYSLLQNGSGTPRPANGAWSIGGRIEADGNNTHGDVASLDAWPRMLSLEEVAQLHEQSVDTTGTFAGPPSGPPPSVLQLDDPGVADSVTAGPLDLAYPMGSMVTV